MMTTRQIKDYIGCTRQAVYIMATNHGWHRTENYVYHVTTKELDEIKSNPLKRGRKFGSKVLHQVKQKKEKFNTSLLESVFK